MQSVKFHSSKDALWTNAAGDGVPVKYVPQLDKVKESLAAKVVKEAIKAETHLLEFHQLLKNAFAEVASMVKEEFDIKAKKKPAKGNITWYNFDKSVKIEAQVNEISKWDNALMTEALTLLNTYMDASLGETAQLIKDLVNSAFATSRGMIDSKKVFQLLKYEDKIKNAKFTKACSLIRQAQSIDKTKLYMRVWVKESSGEYRDINLNFSSL